MALTSHHWLRMFAFCCLTLLILALFIGGHHPSSGKLFPPPWDKAVHFIFYGILTILTSIAFPKTRLLIISLIMISIGGADEVHQMFVPGRHAGLDDLVADAIGIVTAIIVLLGLRKNRHKPKS